jgi:TetR/AcrR family transcriptional repressor of nem operon
VARTREFDTEAAVERAMDLFWSRGFAATSVQDLVDATGVGRGSLYAAFGSKEGLYLAALDRYREQLAVPMVTALRSGAPVRDVVRGLLEGLAAQAVADQQRRGCLMVNAATERCPGDPTVARRVRDTVAANEAALVEALTAARAAGQLGADKDPVALARFLVAVTHGLRVTGVITPEPPVLRDVVEVALGCLD